MATYHFKALRKTDKNKVQGTINADNERHARELLREQELFPTTVKALKVEKVEEKKERKKREQSPLQLMIAEKLSKVGMQEKIAFTQNLEMMVRAGIPITEALLYMESYMDNPKFKKLLNTIRLDILSGSSFSRSLTKHKDIFNDVYVSIIQAGEASGELDAVLKRLSDMLMAEAALRKKVVAALVYPIMVVFIATLVLLIMFTVVLPTFSDMYDKMGIKLPLITQIMVWISNFLRHYWYVSIAIAGAAAFGARKYAKSSTGKTTIDKVLLNTPVVSPLLVAVSASHFISTLNVSFSAGLPITDCIFMACHTVTHTQIRDAFDQINIKIQAGQRLAAAMADAEILPAMIIIMISTGEESGSLEEMLDHCLNFLEEEVNQRVEVLMSMMEPIMLIVLGVIVGAMALSIYLPLFSMYEHVH